MLYIFTSSDSYAKKLWGYEVIFIQIDAHLYVYRRLYIQWMLVYTMVDRMFECTKKNPFAHTETFSFKVHNERDVHTHEIHTFSQILYIKHTEKNANNRKIYIFNRLSNIERNIIQCSNMDLFTWKRPKNSKKAVWSVAN